MCRFNSARFKRFNLRLQVQEMKQAVDCTDEEKITELEAHYGLSWQRFRNHTQNQVLLIAIENRCDTHQEKLLNSLHGQRYSFKWFKSNKDLNLNADALFNAKQENLRVWLLKMLISKKPVPNVNTKDGEYIKCAAENHT
ncbi:hypothetical protein Tco_0414933 [Tanacetum coccineum]